MLTSALDLISRITATVEPANTAFEEKRMQRYGLDPELATIRNGVIIEYRGNVDLSNRGLAGLPFRFVKVLGYFDCSYNRLTSLAGCPKEVGGEFACKENNLVTLKNCPQKAQSFNCSNNSITSLLGAPLKINGSFMCSNNKLKSLAGSPVAVGSVFACEHNEITTLKGGPKRVGNFYCRYNNLMTLDGAPYTKGAFYCGGNPGSSKFIKPDNIIFFNNTTKISATVEPRDSKDPSDALLDSFWHNEILYARKAYAYGFTDVFVHADVTVHKKRDLLLYRKSAVVEFEFYWPQRGHRGIIIASGTHSYDGYSLKTRETWYPSYGSSDELFKRILAKAKAVLNKYPIDAGNS